MAEGSDIVATIWVKTSIGTSPGIIEDKYNA